MSGGTTFRVVPPVSSKAPTKTRISRTFSLFCALVKYAMRFPAGELAKPELRRRPARPWTRNRRQKGQPGHRFYRRGKDGPDFLKAYVPDKPGPIVHGIDGRELGQHRGLHYFTIGQRKGIGVPSNTDHERYVVVGKRASDNALVVFDHPEAVGLFQREVRVHSLSWTSELPADNPKEGRVRYRDPRVPLEFIREGADSALIRFRDPSAARERTSSGVL